MSNLIDANVAEACEFLSSDLVVPLKVARMLEAEKRELWNDLAAWLSLAKRQYAEMPHNEPLCPTSMGIAKTERVLGIAPKSEPNP